jgi:hypothetical protein
MVASLPALHIKIILPPSRHAVLITANARAIITSIDGKNYHYK